MWKSLLGVAIGALITIIGNYFNQKAASGDELSNLVAKERIEAYKELYAINSILTQTYVMTSPAPEGCYFGYINTKNSRIRKKLVFPRVLENEEDFLKFLGDYNDVVNANRIFYNQETLNNAIYISTYINQIFNITNGNDSEYAHMLGFVLYDEIEEINQTLEKIIQEFLNGEKKKMTENDLNKAYDFSNKKLKESELYKIFKGEDKKSFGEFSVCKGCKYYGNCNISL